MSNPAGNLSEALELACRHIAKDVEMTWNIDDMRIRNTYARGTRGLVVSHDMTSVRLGVNGKGDAVKYSVEYLKAGKEAFAVKSAKIRDQDAEDELREVLALELPESALGIVDIIVKGKNMLGSIMK